MAALRLQAEDDDLRMLVVLEESGGVGPSRLARFVIDIRHHPAEFIDLGDEGFVFGLEFAVPEAGKHEEDSRTSMWGLGTICARETRVAQPPSAVCFSAAMFTAKDAKAATRQPQCASARTRMKKNPFLLPRELRVGKELQRRAFNIVQNVELDGLAQECNAVVVVIHAECEDGIASFRHLEKLERTVRVYVFWPDCLQEIRSGSLEHYLYVARGTCSADISAYGVE